MLSNEKKLVSQNGNVVLHRLDKQDLDIKNDEIIVFACVRNERLRLPYFIEYHRKLGVDRFFIVDNGSEDGTVDFLLGEKRIHVYYTDASYAESRCGVDWLNLLLLRHGVGHWSLTLDADEFFVYPMCENVDLHSLAAYMESINAQGMVTFMLDMYSETPIRQTGCVAGEPFKDVCGYFDADTYHQRDENSIPVRGGPRHRLFWQGQDREKPSPVLKKIPFVKWRKELFYEASTHILTGVSLAELTGVLQHYKFLSDFYEQAKAEAQRKEHWDGAAQYESYWDVLGNNPDITAYFAGSVKYKDSSQLVKLKLMNKPESYCNFIKSTG